MVLAGTGEREVAGMGKGTVWNGEMEREWRLQGPWCLRAQVLTTRVSPAVL